MKRNKLALNTVVKKLTHQQRVLRDIAEAMRELKLIEEGKLKAMSFSELMERL